MNTLRWAIFGLLLACDDTPPEPREVQGTELVEQTGPHAAAENGVAENESENADCPPRMVELPTGTCMDRHEAQVESGRAVSAEDQLPSNGLSFNDAASACRAAGFRLCTSAEWNAACGGDDGTDYPYGAEYEQDRCNSAPDGSDLRSRSLAPSGSFPRCVSPLGIYDLSGNTVEWIDAADNTGSLRELRGGSFASYPARAKCEYEHNLFQPTDAAFDGQGFRCCDG